MNFIWLVRFITLVVTCWLSAGGANADQLVWVHLTITPSLQANSPTLADQCTKIQQTVQTTNGPYTVDVSESGLYGWTVHYPSAPCNTWGTNPVDYAGTWDGQYWLLTGIIDGYSLTQPADTTPQTGTLDLGNSNTGTYVKSLWTTVNLPSAPAQTVNTPKNNGAPPCSGPCCGNSASSSSPASPNCSVGDPINAATGNSFQREVDFVGGQATHISLVRSYNSQDRTATPFGTGWRSPWHRSLSIASTQVKTIRADGRQDIFTKNSSGAYAADPDVRIFLNPVLNSSGTQTGWTVITEEDTTETYSLAGLLTSLATRSGLVTTLAYDVNNNLVQVSGPFGHKLAFMYDGSNRVSQMTAPDGSAYKYAYGANNNLVSVTYPDSAVRKYLYENSSFPNALTGIIDELGNRFATWSYDSQGRATSSQHAGGADLTTLTYSAGSTTVTDARNNAFSYTFATQFGLSKPIGLTGASVQISGGKAFTYDGNGFIASRTDWNGNVTTYTHDARGNETSRTEASGTPLARTISTTWHATFHLPMQITEPNRTKTFAYDAKGNPLNITIKSSGLTRSFSYTYNTVGQVLTATDPRGNVTKYAYDAKGDLARVTNALGQVTSFPDYDANGRLLKFVDPNGVATTLTYDPRGRITSRTVASLKTTYAYDAAGNLTKITQPDGSYLGYSYDQAHRLISVSDAVGDKIIYTLDATSNRVKEQAFDPSNALRRTRSYAYDAINHLSQSIRASGQTTNYSYDLQSNLTSISDPLSHTNSYSYDALNRLVQAIDPNGGATSFSYDVNDHPISVTDPRNLGTTYGWDGLNNQTAASSPDAGVTSRTFDAAGNVVSSTDARGAKTTYSYDVLNRRTRADYADDSSASWEYDLGPNAIGRLSRIRDVTGMTSYRYDANGHVTGKQQVISSRGAKSVNGQVPDGGTLTTLYAYDSGGRLASITYPSGRRVGYAYDAAGRVIGETLYRRDGEDSHDDDSSPKSADQTLAAGVTYFPFGEASGWNAGNGAAYQRNFDQDGRVSSLSLPAKNNISLAYDAASRITGIKESLLPAKSFNYDALDRLTGFTAGSVTQSYEYDADGNRTSMSVRNGSTTNVYGYSYTTTSNRLLSVSGASTETFAYDAAGNLASRSGPAANYIFTYDAKSRMSQATVGALSEAYGINGLGQRVSKSDARKGSSTLFVYDEAGRIIGEYDQNGKVIEETVWLGDLPVATLQPSGTFYIAPDHLGAPHQITNANRGVVWLWDHDPFGNGAPTGAAAFFYNARFPGQYAGQLTGLNYNYFRDYDPKLGRYIESDPIGLKGGINTYGYVRGNPLTNSDPTGLIIPFVCGLAVEATIFCTLNPAYCLDVAKCLAKPFGSTGMPPSNTALGSLCDVVPKIIKSIPPGSGSPNPPWQPYTPIPHALPPPAPTPTPEIPQTPPGERSVPGSFPSPTGETYVPLQGL